MTDISSERIERAAQAIWVKSGNKEPWPTESSIGKNMYRLAAKAALEADASAIERLEEEEELAAYKASDEIKSANLADALELNGYLSQALREANRWGRIAREKYKALKDKMRGANKEQN